MKRLVAIALIAACSNEEAGVDFPIEPGGGVGVGGSSRPDAAVDAAGGDGDSSTTITGRVCMLVEDLRTLTNCATTGADNLTVTLGTSVATTAADGTFTITRPAVTAGLSWQVTGQAIVSSRVAFGSTTTLPAFGEAAYATMVADNNVVSSELTARMVVRVRQAGAPVVGATVATVPDPESLIYYDGNDDSTWETVGGTGNSGVAWIPSIASDSAQLTIVVDVDTMLTANVGLSANTITFVLAEIP